jgi:hypothetical protein
LVSREVLDFIALLSTIVKELSKNEGGKRGREFGADKVN